ncbi:MULTISPECIES: YadA-like family protein [Bradyrhizobium]|uniref:Trimeric autotransporter adhesin YadA-like C-terminal membrane anchor domain-containing protein n=1 Tax=Bradyrhizobium vignae TaxID=1549949 RepID=A0A2U3Q2M2_9BRAD|nr:YadA C-terminal domain-containing protein [Bradyrhizobium vignae]RXH05444.1 hypothetical protein EAV90_05710 [Bradyrhizobium vignae]SPP95673.1 exported protein of unknown function [Bradyrhizobium vignae]
MISQQSLTSRSLKNWGPLLAVAACMLAPKPAHAIHAVCSFVNGSEQQVLIVQDDDCSNPFDPFFAGPLLFGDSIHAAQDMTVDGTTTTGTTNVNGNSTFATGTTATFNGNAVFNGGVTFAGSQNFSGINNTGNISTDTLSTTGNATIGGTLNVAGLATFNGITNTGNLTTDTLTANTSVNTPLINATNANVTTATITTANVTTANVTTANMTTANVTTANIGTANITTALQVSPGASVNMGANRIQNVAAPLAGTDAANKSYVDASLSALGGQFDQALAGVNSRIDEISNRTTKATAGVAMAMAMAGVPTVLPSERVAFTMNYGNFQGQNGLALNGAVRLNDNLQFTGGVGYSTNQNLVGARAGLRVGW